MAKELDVYREWLGIQETTRPLNFYQLLRLEKFEDRVEPIRSNYRKMNAHVRKFAAGDYANESQQLLNELAKAMLCLTDLKRKREYDATLGRKADGEGRRRSFEEILLAGKILDQAQLDKARNYATAINIDLRDAVLQQKMAVPEAVMSAYAESEGLAFVDLDDVGVAENLVSKIPSTVARERACVPVMIDEGQLLMAAPNPLVPDVEEQLRMILDMPIRTVLCTMTQANEAVAKHFPRDGRGPDPSTSKKQATSADSDAEDSEVDGETRKKQIVYVLIGANVGAILYMLLDTFFFQQTFSSSMIFDYFKTGLIYLSVGIVGAGVGWCASKFM